MLHVCLGFCFSPFTWHSKVLFSWGERQRAPYIRKVHMSNDIETRFTVKRGTHRIHLVDTHNRGRVIQSFPTGTSITVIAGVADDLIEAERSEAEEEVELPFTDSEMDRMMDKEVNPQEWAEEYENYLDTIEGERAAEKAAQRYYEEGRQGFLPDMDHYC